MNSGSVSPEYVDVAVVLGVGGLLAIWAIQRRLVRKRTEAVRTEAHRIGFNFEGEDWTDRRGAPLLKTALFTRGHSPQFKNIMTGSRDGLKVSIFDYWFAEGSGRSTRNYKQTVGTFSKAGASLPYFEMRPSGVADKVWDALAHKNIQFESDPEFSRHWVLRGALDDKVRSLFAPALLAFLKGLVVKEKWRIEGTSDTLILYQYAKTTPPAELCAFLDQTTSIASGFFGLVTPAALANR